MSETFLDLNNNECKRGQDSNLNVNVVDEGGERVEPVVNMYHYFYQSRTLNIFSQIAKNSVLFGESIIKKDYQSKDYGFFGKILGNKKENRGSLLENDDSAEDEDKDDTNLFLNVSNPFCLVCVGVQGAGKSHSMNIVLENCLTQVPLPLECPITSVRRPVCGLVLHHDQSVNNVCEATGLHAISRQMDGLFGLKQRGITGVKRMVVLASPSFYKQRKLFYKDAGFEVRPLLFKWSSLGAEQLKKLMRLSEKDAQLYVSVMLDLLRGYQRRMQMPQFAAFLKEVTKVCDLKAQGGPLKQRLQLLQSVVLESYLNVNLAAEGGEELVDLLASGTLVVADLTDPMLSADEANGIFQVLLEQFRNCHLPGGVGKVVAFDEAHKYLSNAGAGGGGGKDGLSTAIVNTVRLMRHEGIRVLISTQSPMALPAELLELASVTVVHHFQSSDWYTYLSSKIPMPKNGFSVVKRLKTGEALTICTKITYKNSGADSRGTEPEDSENDIDDSAVLLQIRPRVTVDYGSSKTAK